MMAEPVSKILVYDLPSENRTVIKDNGHYEKVKNVRISAVRALHSLGCECTESVILISPARYDKVDDIIQYVMRRYEALVKDLGVSDMKPIIRVLELTPSQATTFKEIAESKLKEKLDEIIERIARLISELSQIEEEIELKKVKRAIRRGYKTAKEIEEIAKELGLEANEKFALLYELYNEAFEKLKRGVD